jgi:hypothetical protein
VTGYLYKATFKCDECGYRWEPSGGIADMRPPCPNCAKLTYGPLTEDIVADVIKFTEDPGTGDWIPYGCLDRDDQERYLRKARFVLRLLDALGRKDAYSAGVRDAMEHAGFGADTVRDWLLDLARKS